ncbi:MAG: multiprotein-bridging factor 1 family protein [Phycisphaerae bacterium]
MNYEPGNTRTTENLNPFFNHSLSADVVEYLRTVRDMTLKQIGDMLDLSESVISRVANKQRNFSRDHLVRLEGELGAPVPLLSVVA